jgi:hypothetical protein
MANTFEQEVSLALLVRRNYSTVAKVGKVVWNGRRSCGSFLTSKWACVDGLQMHYRTLKETFLKGVRRQP